MQLAQEHSSGRAADRTRLRRFLAVSAAWTIGLAVIADPLWVLVWYLAFAFFAVALMWRRSSTLPTAARAATLPVAWGAALSITGLAVRALHIYLSGEANPFPSPADLFNLAAYLILIAAVLRIVRNRAGRVGLDPILDASVAAVAAALLQWSLILIPYLSSDGLSRNAVIVNLIYSSLSLLLVVVAVLALVAGSIPSTSNRLLAAALTALFAADAAAVLATAGIIPDGIGIAFAPVALVLGTAGVLHPSVVTIADPPNAADRHRRLTRRRVTVLALALLTPPILLVAAALQADDVSISLMLPAITSLALTPLVVTRLGRLVRQNEEMASLEATLRSVGERLVSAESTDDVARVISVGAADVLGETFIAGGLVIDPASAQAPGRSGEVGDAVAALQRQLGADWSGSESALFELQPESDAVVTTVSLVMVQHDVKAALVVQTSRSFSEDERNAIGTLTRESAIALRAVEQTEIQVRERSEARFASLIDNSSDIVTVLNDELKLAYVSPVATRLLGFDLRNLEEVEVLRLVHEDDRDTAVELVARIRSGQRDSAEIRLHHSDGTYRWFDVNGTDLSADPNIAGLVLNLREVSDRIEAEHRRALSEARFKALVQNSTDLVVVFDQTGSISYASPSLELAVGRAVEQIHSTQIQDLFADAGVDWTSVLSGASTEQTSGSALFEFTFRNVDDDLRTIETLVSDLRDEAAVSGFVLNARDVTERRGMEQALRYKATHDELTGLANRVHALDELDGMLGRNSGSTTVAAILIGLDDFKEVNESLGHGVGDQLLCEAAHRITGLLAFGDVAARVGGDEFVVVLERGHGENHVTDLADQILAAIALPFTIDGRDLNITASAGIVFDHDRSSAGEILLRNADIAMFRAKTRGKRQVVVFEAQMHTASFDRMELRADLARAVASEQFVAHYQPVIDIETHQIVGAEALIRWNHPERGLVGPGLFIPLAEETGMIGALGEWILERACTDLAQWRADYGDMATDLTISVNLSVQQLHDDLILSKVRDILSRTGLPAERLVLEVTESTLITETDKASATMQELRAMGSRLAVDDFGTGYSSLGYIQQFEFDVLKIDKSFIDGIESETNAQIVAAVLELANQLRVRTIAEGIESEAQDRILNEMGCRYGQGFLYSRPVPEREFRELLVADRVGSTHRVTL